MLREMGEALEALTAERPLVLILEDLHWSDYSTLDLISYLARKRQPAQDDGHRHLSARGVNRQRPPAQGRSNRSCLANNNARSCHLNTQPKVRSAEYLSVRFPANVFPAELAGLIHERTDGNPLFMVNAVDYLLAEKLISRDQRELGINCRRSRTSSRSARQHQADDREATRSSRSAATADPGSGQRGRSKVFNFRRGGGTGRGSSFGRSRVRGTGSSTSIHPGSGVQSTAQRRSDNRYRFIHALYQNVLYERSTRRGEFNFTGGSVSRLEAALWRRRQGNCGSSWRCTLSCG